MWIISSYCPLTTLLLILVSNCDFYIFLTLRSIPTLQPIYRQNTSAQDTFLSFPLILPCTPHMSVKMCGESIYRWSYDCRPVFCDIWKLRKWDVSSCDTTDMPILWWVFGFDWKNGDAGSTWTTAQVVRFTYKSLIESLCESPKKWINAKIYGSWWQQLDSFTLPAPLYISWTPWDMWESILAVAIHIHYTDFIWFPIASRIPYISSSQEHPCPTSFSRLFLCRHEGEWADTGKARSIVYICAVPLIPHMSEIFVIYEILAYAMNIPCNAALYLLNSKSTTSQSAKHGRYLYHGNTSLERNCVTVWMYLGLSIALLQQAPFQSAVSVLPTRLRS